MEWEGLTVVFVFKFGFDSVFGESIGVAVNYTAYCFNFIGWLSIVDCVLMQFLMLCLMLYFNAVFNAMF